MPVHEFRRIADVFGRDGFDAGFEQFVVGAPGDDDFESEAREQGEPERVVFVHVEHAGYADFAARGLFIGQAAVGEGALVFEVVQVGPVAAFAFGVAAAFAPVAGHIARSVVECGDGELAVVLAQFAHVAFGRHRQLVEGGAVQDARDGVVHAVDARHVHAGGVGVAVRVVGDVVVVHARGERGAVGAHESGDVGACHFAFGEQFERAQHGVVEERAALHHDRVAQFARIAQFDDLVQCVAHDGIAQAGGDVFDARAFFLRLLDARVHEHRAPRAQVHGVFGGERGLRELLDGQAHGAREGLQERPAAR